MNIETHVYKYRNEEKNFPYTGENSFEFSCIDLNFNE